MKAVVMAGGEGTRLRPLTSSRPKPLVPILNKPCMQHTIELLKRYGVTDIVVTLYYLADEIEGYFGDGSELGVNLIYTVEDTPLGTAGSVKKAEEYLKDDTFIIVSGDALTDLDVDKALAFHREKGSVATLVLQHVDNPLEFGVVITDDDGRIRRFLEKPSWGEVFSDTVNTGHVYSGAVHLPVHAAREELRLVAGHLPADPYGRKADVRLCPGRILDRCRLAPAVPAGAVRDAGRA